MQDRQEFLRIPVEQAADLPRLPPPAGYVVVIQDVDYGNRFKIARLQQIDRDQIRRAVDLSIETRLALVLQADNAAALALSLHDQFAARGSPGEWFDLDDAGLGQLDEIGRPQATSLRRLALNEMGGKSLVEDARIVRSAPESPFARMQRRQKQPRRSRRAWLLLLLIVAALALVVARSSDVSRGLERLLHHQPTSPPSSSRSRESYPPARLTPTDVPGKGEVFFVRTRAWARSCASLTCRSVQTLDAGARIVTLRYESGQTVAGDDTWITFASDSSILYVHRSALGRMAPTTEFTASPTQPPTSSPTPTDTTTATATNSATAAATASPTPVLTHTDTATAMATNTATVIATASPTQTLMVTAAAPETNSLIVKTVNDLNARVRACASTNCEILGHLRPGAVLTPTGEVEGQTVNGSSTWVEFTFQGEKAFIHSSLVAANS